MTFFTKILIANRGEIAVRIARACASLGIRSVAVYSDVDRAALHKRVCDESYYIGLPAATESYLRAEKLLDVAQKAGCDAVHPGYGFLAENEAFAQAVIDAGIAWIGPSPAAIALMGSKIESKRLAVANGVPIVPGYFGDDQTLGTLVREADQVGFPLLIKASAGGGGKGMRVVTEAAGLEAALDGARREALAAFGDDSVMLERYLSRPRHIEVQIMGDKAGKIIHLGERDCSIQRRHQKVVEESPSPAISPETRAAMTSAALKLAAAARYENAGTIEFIYQDGEFFFLEMNTRLQVEHPVTEEALGLDVVQMQIAIAAGQPLQIEQDDVKYKGHALEVRLYAEDPDKGFLPSTGTLRRLRLPGGQPGVRVDAGVEQGDSVSPFYDPMIAKIITFARTREESVRAMQEALGYTDVAGVQTNLGFLRWLVANPSFEAGNFSTRFIDEQYTPGAHPGVPPLAILAGAIAIDMERASGAQGTPVWHSGPWRHSRQDMPIYLLLDGRPYSVRLSSVRGQGAIWQACIFAGEELLGVEEIEVSVVPVQSGSETSTKVQMELSGTNPRQMTFRYNATDGLFRVEVGSRHYWAAESPGLSTETLQTPLHLKDEDNLESPMPGKVLKVMVAAGDIVTDGQPLVIVEAMKMEFTVKAPHDGKVERVRYSVGQQVAVGDVLVELGKHR